MITFPNCKINLGLYVTEKRQDGFHNIVSCFYPVNWLDILEFIPAPKTEFTTSGITIPGQKENNLCLKVWELFNKKYQIPPVHIHLHKEIPIGAGLGGGSSDAAFTAKLLNEFFSLGISDESLETLIKPLGSDCAFFIRNKATIACGKGDEFKSVNISLKGKWIVLIYPGIHISTQEAYSGVVPAIPENNIKEVLESDISNWKRNLFNDFEKHLFHKYPVLEGIKTDLYKFGAVYASMTGSGSCIYGLFDQEPSDIKSLSKPGFVVKKFIMD